VWMRILGKYSFLLSWIERVAIILMQGCSAPMEQQLVVSQALNFMVLPYYPSCNHSTGLIGDVDYAFSEDFLTIVPGSTSVNVIVVIMDDDVVESTENFTLTIDENVLRAGVVVGEHGVIEICINDNDGKCIKIKCFALIKKRKHF